jgi:hypothetical protein
MSPFSAWGKLAVLGVVAAGAEVSFASVASSVAMGVESCQADR